MPVRLAACWPCFSGISFLAAAEGQGNVASEEPRQRSASFFVSCEATTGESAAVRHNAITAMRIKCLGQYVLKVMFSPIVKMSLETIGASMRRHCHKP